MADLTVSNAVDSLMQAADAAGIRTAAGLGTMATQAASSVSISGGSISGITELAVADGNPSEYVGWIGLAAATDAAWYSVSSAQYDPQHRSASDYAGRRLRMYHSPDDAIVTLSGNATPIFNLANGYATEVAIESTTGAHTAYENYNYATAYEFVARSLSIVAPVKTLYFPLQGGPGSSNTNRDVHWVGSDGTGGVISNAVVNGTVSTFWANTCPYAQDWCINYGGAIAANGAFVPGRIGSGNDAAGNAKTLTAGKHGNPYSRINRNRWSAPSLVNIGVTSSDSVAPSTDVQAASVVDTQFARIGTDGSDRYFATREALTGSDKTNAEAYTA